MEIPYFRAVRGDFSPTKLMCFEQVRGFDSLFFRCAIPPVRQRFHTATRLADANMGLLDPTDHDGSIRSEWQAVYRENLIRGELGIPLRVSHRSTYNGQLSPASPFMIDVNNQPVKPTWNNYKLR